MVNVIEETREQQDKRMAWWREAKFGMFIHWGLHSVTAGMRKGTVWYGGQSFGPGDHWVQSARTPIKEAEQLPKKFNPARFNPKEWVQIAKEAGMKWMVLTLKHHDGFCMFDTKLTDYNIVKATPFKRDPFKELAEACREEGIRLGFYYSQRPDFHHPDGGNYWDYDLSKQSYSRYLREYVKPQIRELLTNYGPIAVVWFDIGTPIPELAMELKQLIRKIQPAAIISGRIVMHPSGTQARKWLRLSNTGIADYMEVGDHEIPEEEEGIEGDWETPACTSGGWMYSSYDHNWKSAGTLVQWLVAIVSRGGNYLLNVGPTGEGIIPEPCAHELKGVGEWLKVNGESIYGASASPIPSPVTVSVQPPQTGRVMSASANPRVAPYQCTAKPGKFYVHIFAWPWDGKFKVSRVSKEVKRAYLLANHGELKFNQEGEDVVISVPDKAPDPIDTVVVLEINK